MPLSRSTHSLSCSPCWSICSSHIIPPALCSPRSSRLVCLTAGLISPCRDLKDTLNSTFLEGMFGSSLFRPHRVLPLFHCFHLHPLGSAGQRWGRHPGISPSSAPHRQSVAKVGLVFPAIVSPSVPPRPQTMPPLSPTWAPESVSLQVCCIHWLLLEMPT